MDFFFGGGFPMLFIALFGAIGLAHAGRYALWPGPARERVPPIAAYAVAIACAAVAGVAVDLATAAHYVAVTLAADDPAERLDATTAAAMALQGFSESMAPAILGFAIDSAIALLVATGLRRSPSPL